MMPALEELAGLMSARAGGAKVTTAEAARVALRRGVEVLRGEMGGEPPAKEKKRPGKA